MQDDSLLGWGLRSIELSDQATLQPFFSSLIRPLSDYTFSQVFTWRNSLRLLWRLIDDHLCVFANGSGDLTLLLPPIASAAGASNPSVLKRAFELMDDYNSAHGVPDRSRVEYVSQVLLGSLGSTGMSIEPMGHDYVYDTQRMIDLAGGDLKSKRQERGRFIRDNPFEAKIYEGPKHLAACIRLLDTWKNHQDANHSAEENLNTLKRQKETFATELALRHADELGLVGMVVFVADRLSAFTFGERLGVDQASIVIEKTDPAIKGLPQFIFSEFCKVCWADRPRINAGDDWGLENLAWTKNSYRPVELMKKFVVRKEAVAQAVSNFDRSAPESGPLQMTREPSVVIRRAVETDIAAAEALESACFDKYRLSRRQLRAFHRSETAIFQVAVADGAVVGECVALTRRSKTGISARLYSLAVSNDFRGQRIGQRLLNGALAELTARGAKRVHLQVEASNTSAIRLYTQHHFRAVKTLPDYYGTDRDGMHMVCELNREIVDSPAALTPAA